MDLNDLITLSVKDAESVLKTENIKYRTVKIKTFKLDKSDTEAVVKVGKEGDTAIIYICSFLCNAGA